MILYLFFPSSIFELFCSKLQCLHWWFTIQKFFIFLIHECVINNNHIYNQYLCVFKLIFWVRPLNVFYLKHSIYKYFFFFIRLFRFDDKKSHLGVRVRFSQFKSWDSSYLCFYGGPHKKGKKLILGMVCRICIFHFSFIFLPFPWRSNAYDVVIYKL